MAKHQITRVETLHEGFRRMLKLSVRTPDGDSMDREVVEQSEAVAVLPYDPERRTGILIRQFRAPVFHAAGETEIVEALAGLLDEDEPQDCARREAMEEVGLRLGSLEHVASAWSSPGLSTEKVHLYLAPYAAADRVEQGGGLAEEHEDIAVLEVPLTELAAMLARGGIADLKTVTLIQALRLRRPELFQ